MKRFAIVGMLFGNQCCGALMDMFLGSFSGLGWVGKALGLVGGWKGGEVSQ